MLTTGLNRRAFIAGAVASAAPLLSPLRAVGERSGLTVTARDGLASLLEDGGPQTKIWGYDGLVPGPVLRVRQGETFSATLQNDLKQPTTIHWHGIRNENSMDGVAGLTQPAVKPGESFDYRFAPPDAGTYWYHPHNRTWEQLARGLYGAFIVEEQTPPNVDQDLPLIFDDWRLEDDGAIQEKSLGGFHDKSHGGRLGNVLTLNGQPTFDVSVKAGERLRLRLINSANARIMGIIFEGHTPLVIALDGQPVTPFAPKKNMVVLAPAQRADLVLDCAQVVGSRTRILVDVGREKLHIGDVVYHATKRAREKVLTDLFLLPENPMPVDLASTPTVRQDLIMTGGARKPFKSAIYKGKEYPVRELFREHGMIWAFNGIAAMAEEPFGRYERGDTVHIKMVNNTAWPHAMHFHGHHVLEVAHSKRSPYPYWRDTVFMEADDEVTVAFKAHNPGKWMLHCHMLEHQAGGMGTWYEVV